MKKRITSVILACLMLVSLIPPNLVTVSAASGHSFSEDVVTYIKSWEGFSEKAFWDVSQWTIGYGTSSTEGATITKEAADAALREELKKIDSAINEFAEANHLEFNQGQHDALASLCFNVGTQWLNQTGRLRTAILNGATGNDFLFAISLWANVSSVSDRGLLLRRLSEANLYLNGTYSKSVPSNFAYVILDPNGGTAGHGGEDKMQGYLSSTAVPFYAAEPSKQGSAFGGWYTAVTGGEAVKELTAQTAGKTLYAQWGIQVKVTGEYVNVRSGAGTSHSLLGTKKANDTFVIVETTKVGKELWGRFSDGWVALKYTDYASVSNDSSLIGKEEAALATGVVTCGTYLNVRKGAGTQNPVTGSAPNGTKVTVYEYATVDGQRWGRIGSGWISLAYVKMDSNSGSASEENNTGTTKPENADPSLGTVTGSGVNVRKAAGVGNAIVTVLNKGTSVKVYEQVTKDNAPWGRIEQGWICMNYVKLNDNTQDAPSDPVVATGTVSAKTNLNVRSGAGTNYGIVGSMSYNSKVNVYEIVTVNGQKWGRVSQNQWVCLTYVKLNSETGNTSGENTGIGTGKVTSKTVLNIRSSAGTGSVIVGSYPSGASVTILEQKDYYGVKWGRTDKGWVCMTYVQMNSSDKENTGNAATGNSASGIVWN